MKKLLANCYSNFEKNKMILYLVEISLKWLKRIQDQKSNIVDGKREFEGDYGIIYKRLLEVVSQCLQKELRIISANVEMGSPEFHLKYLILFRNMHRIMPTYGAESNIKIDSNFTDKESKDKSKLLT